MQSDSRPTVLHLVHSLEGGGTERTLGALLHELDGSKLRHVVVTQRDAGHHAAQLPDSVACRALGASGRSRSTWFALRRIVSARRPVVVHARNTGTWADAILACARRRRVRLVLGFHGLENSGSFSPRQRLLARCGRLAGARFTSVSLAGRRKLQHDAGVPAHLVNVLPNGVDLRRFSKLQRADRAAIRAELRLPRDTLAIAAVGSLTPVKGHDGLLRALARSSAPACRLSLVIIGDGPLRNELCRTAEALGIADRVILAGPREDVPAVLGAMDAYVCGSTSEGMSNALLEAMAAGLPVVATDVGDNAEVVRDQVDGLIVNPGDYEQIADRFALLASRPDLRVRLGSAARERAAGYEFPNTVRSYSEFYERLAAETGRVSCTRLRSNVANRTPHHVEPRDAVELGPAMSDDGVPQPV